MLVSFCFAGLESQVIVHAYSRRCLVSLFDGINHKLPPPYCMIRAKLRFSTHGLENKTFGSPFTCYCTSPLHFQSCGMLAPFHRSFAPALKSASFLRRVFMSTADSTPVGLRSWKFLGESLCSSSVTSGEPRHSCTRVRNYQVHVRSLHVRILK
jgi:hypothetical protein